MPNLYPREAKDAIKPKKIGAQICLNSATRGF